MNINSLAKNPCQVFEESFEDIDYQKAGFHWQKSLEQALAACEQERFRNGYEILRILEKKSNLRFAKNKFHHISNFGPEGAVLSEACGSLLIFLIWLRCKEGFPKVIVDEGAYYFITPNGEISRVNSNHHEGLSTSEKFNLFDSENAKQLNFFEVLKNYYEELCDSYIREEKLLSLMKAQSYMIQLDPRDIKWFARRGLIQKRLGNFSDALSDLKRFLSFQSYEEAPEAVKAALIELEGLRAFDNFSDYSIH